VDLLLWRGSVYDVDGDGYAVYWVDKSDRETTSTIGGVVPDGWAEKRGDFDDNDPNVHPRRSEVYGNGIDDDCDGKIDETEVQYYPSGNDNTTDGFNMELKINDPAIVDAYLHRTAVRSLYYQVECQNLRWTDSPCYTAKIKVASMTVYPSYVRMSISLSGLGTAQVYRARVQFFQGSYAMGFSEVGDVSNWYYTITDYNGVVGHARMQAVLQGLYEFYASEHAGLVGYRGSVYEYGTRYGADPGQAWCSEFYAWVVDPYLKSLGTVSYYGDLIDYFDDCSSYYSVDSASDFVNSANPGDYLAVDRGDGDINHSCMFLAYDHSTGQCWTLDGNSTGTASDWTYGGREYRCGGDEVWIRETSPDDVAGWGKWIPSMIE
jgi:hypothetical protein